MGLFSFLKNAGKSLGIGREADEIKQDIVTALGDSVENLHVAYDDGTVTLRGTVASHAAREKAVLLAGNVKSVDKVDDRLTVKVAEQAVAAAPAEREMRFYTIKSGDSLSKIAKNVYGDASKWKALFEANREVIKDPDKIYPDQQIRIPELG